MGSKRQEKTRSRRKNKTQIGVKRGNLSTRKGARKKSVHSSGRHATGNRLYGQAHGRALEKILAEIAKVKEAIEKRNKSAARRKLTVLKTSLDAQASAARSAEYTQEAGDAFIQLKKPYIQLKKLYDQTKSDLEAAIDRQGRESQVSQFLGEEIYKLQEQYAQKDRDHEATMESLNEESQMNAQQQAQISRLRAICEKQHSAYEAELSRVRGEYEKKIKYIKKELTRLGRLLYDTRDDPLPSGSVRKSRLRSI